MNLTLKRRAILIALLLFLSQNLNADEKQQVASVEAKPVTAVTDSQNSATIAPRDQEPADQTSENELEANPNKEKLTMFFGIGLIINIVMMSLFAYWAIGQWRKSSNPRGKQ